MSQIRRFFALPEERQGDIVNVTSEYHHMARVLRMKAGDKAVICFNDGWEHLSVVENIDGKSVVLRYRRKPSFLRGKRVLDHALFRRLQRGQKRLCSTEKRWTGSKPRSAV